ncbi:MAG: class I SAM-dependent methyltransferase [Holosporales bacterium]|jgi:phospholipid N-methyltransferase|nr:class I SAM-dependent methyltransferase [Holosporales bacterium]
MHISLQQTSWHDIDLVQLADNIGHNVKSWPDSRLFDAFYKKLFENGRLDLRESFVANKHALADKFAELLGIYSNRNASILSIGVGTGIIEAHMIKSGWKVDLQEIQETSIEYFRHNHQDLLGQTKIYSSYDLSDIPTESYDVIICSIVTYACKLEIVRKILAAVGKILKRGGAFIWCDVPLTWQEIYQYTKFWLYNHLYNVPYKRNGIFWGEKRSISVWHKLAKEAGLSLLDQTYLHTQTRDFIRPPHYFGTAFGKDIAEQIAVYKKL